MCAVSGVLYDVTHIHTDTQRPEEKNRKLVLVWSCWSCWSCWPCWSCWSWLVLLALLVLCQSRGLQELRSLGA